MSKPAFRPTSQDTDKAILRGVHYEIWMLVLLLPCLRKVQCHHDCAYLESVLLHTRILIHSFERSKDRRHKHDVLAEDFGFLARPVDIDQDVRNRLNQDLAHLTYESVRREPIEKEWKMEFLIPLLKRCREFIQFVLASILTDAQDQRRHEFLALQSEIDSLVRRPDSEAGG